MEKQAQKKITVYLEHTDFEQLSRQARATHRSRGGFVREILSQAGIISPPERNFQTPMEQPSPA